MSVKIVGKIRSIETIAVGSAIRERARLERVYGPERWRKRKGVTRVRVGLARTFLAEVHWYEASGIGRKEFKIKRILSE